MAQAQKRVQKPQMLRRLTLAEVNHLLSLLEDRRDSGLYYGPREQYYARTERLIKWCNEQIEVRNG